MNISQIPGLHSESTSLSPMNLILYTSLEILGPLMFGNLSFSPITIVTHLIRLMTYSLCREYIRSITLENEAEEIKRTEAF